MTGKFSDRKMNTSISEWAKLKLDGTSGVPRGSVLGLVLFVLFINDLPDELIAEAFLFADDTKVFNIVKSIANQHELQDDMGRLSDWSMKWLMPFNMDKCKQMHCGRNREVAYQYSLNGQNLQTVTNEKDIGVVIDSELSFESHISEKVKKENSMFAMIRRAFKYLTPEIFVTLYKSLASAHPLGICKQCLVPIQEERH